MNLNYVSEENISDDEIFFGKITLKEVKKCIFMNQRHRQTIPCLTANKTEQDSEDECIRIIETHSEPDLVVVDNTLNTELKSISSPNFISNNQNRISTDVNSDDSFIRLEKMVSNLCMSPKSEQPQLNSTIEVVDFILNNGEEKRDNIIDSTKTLGLEILNKECLTKLENTEMVTNNVQVQNSPKIKTEVAITNTTEDLKSTLKCESDNLINTPRNKSCVLRINKNDSIFKTPQNPVKKPTHSSKNTPLSSKHTPSRSKAYQHISSPIASYIKNCPQVPLLKDVHPRKPLPGISSIPKPLKPSTQLKPIDKENIHIPPVAYKSAKKTKMVSIPDSERMPAGEWTNKLTSSIKKPVVIKHDHRVVHSHVKNLNKRQEDSFANLSLHQADLSLCTKKSAFS